MNMFILKSVMLKGDTQIKLLKIDMTDKNLYKPGKNIYIVSTDKGSPKFKENTLKSFLDGVRRTLLRQVEHVLEKSPLTHYFPRLAGAINLSITEIKTNRDSCEAKMAKLLLKPVSQERISVKESVETKKQFSKVVNDLATVEEEKFLRSNKFRDRLDTFYAKLCIPEYSPLWEEFLIISCMFHSLSAVERVFNFNADTVADNQSDHSLMA